MTFFSFGVSFSYLASFLEILDITINKSLKLPKLAKLFNILDAVIALDIFSQNPFHKLDPNLLYKSMIHSYMIPESS